MNCFLIPLVNYTVYYSKSFTFLPLMACLPIPKGEQKGWMCFAHSFSEAPRTEPMFFLSIDSTPQATPNSTHFSERVAFKLSSPQKKVNMTAVWMAQILSLITLAQNFPCPLCLPPITTLPPITEVSFFNLEQLLLISNH